MLQKITLIGNLGSDPEMRYTDQGVPVTNFRMATTVQISKTLPGGGERPCPEGWKESYNGNSWEYTTWWRVATWRGLAETCNRFLKTGRKVYVEATMSGDVVNGIMEPRVFEDNSGKHRASYEVTATVVKFLDSAGSGGDNSGGGLPLDPTPPAGDDWEA